MHSSGASLLGSRLCGASAMTGRRESCGTRASTGSAMSCTRQRRAGPRPSAISAPTSSANGSPGTSSRPSTKVPLRLWSDSIQRPLRQRTTACIDEMPGSSTRGIGAQRIASEHVLGAKHHALAGAGIEQRTHGRHSPRRRTHRRSGQCSAPRRGPARRARPGRVIPRNGRARGAGRTCVPCQPAGANRSNSVRGDRHVPHAHRNPLRNSSTACSPSATSRCRFPAAWICAATRCPARRTATRCASPPRRASRRPRRRSARRSPPATGAGSPASASPGACRRAPRPGSGPRRPHAALRGRRHACGRSRRGRRGPAEAAAARRDPGRGHPVLGRRPARWTSARSRTRSSSSSRCRARRS